MNDDDDDDDDGGALRYGLQPKAGKTSIDPGKRHQKEKTSTGAAQAGKITKGSPDTQRTQEAESKQKTKH